MVYLKNIENVCLIKKWRLMTLKWRVSNYAHCLFLNSEYFIYICLISKFPNYTAICEIRQEYCVIDENHDIMILC